MNEDSEQKVEQKIEDAAPVEAVTSVAMDDMAKPKVPLSIDQIKGSEKLEGETTKAYYERRKAEAKAVKMYLRGRIKPHPGAINSRG